MRVPFAWHPQRTTLIADQCQRAVFDRHLQIVASEVDPSFSAAANSLVSSCYDHYSLFDHHLTNLE